MVARFFVWNVFSECFCCLFQRLPDNRLIDGFLLIVSENLNHVRFLTAIIAITERTRSDKGVTG